MSVFDHDAFDDHEEVHFFRDAASGLRAIIAVHQRVNGVAGGGVRMWPYESEAAALTDALRLSQAMSYKMALAGLPLGGGKSVILGDARRDKSAALFHAFGRAVESLGGSYICGEDVGTTPADMALIHQVTDHVVGLEGASGDTSPATGAGVFQGLRAAVKHKLGREDLAGLTVAVQGAGNVGRHLAGHLKAAGCRILVADVNPDAVRRAVAEFDATSVPADEIITADADVLAPCALGAVLNQETIPNIKAGIVCGGANNQLGGPRDGVALAGRGILYAPDYVVNAGGVMSATREKVADRVDPAEIRHLTDGIYDTCLRIFARAEAEGLAASEAADREARAILGRD